MKRRVLIALLAVALLLSMTACGGGSTAETAQPDDKPTVSDTQTEDEPPTVPDDSQQEQEQSAEPEQEPAPIPEQTTTPEPSVETTPAPEVEPEQPVVTPEPEQEPAPVAKPEPTPEQTVAPTPTPEPAPEVEPEQPVVIPEPEQEPDFEIVITPEATPAPETAPEVETTGNSWVEGEPHDMPKEGDIIITADGTRHTITRDPISGVLGGGLDVRYDIWAGYTKLGNPWTEADGTINYGYVHGYDNGITGRDTTSLLKDPITGVTHTGSEWAALSKAYYVYASDKGSYEGEIRNNWFKWEDNGWTWIGPVG